MKRLAKLFIISLFVTLISQFGSVANNGKGCNIGIAIFVIFGVEIFIAMCEYRKNRVTPLYVVFS